MKRGITVEYKRDESGRVYYTVKKNKGKLTLDEIKEAMMAEADHDYYGVILKCMDEDISNYYVDDFSWDGDCVDLYPATDFLYDAGRVWDSQS